MKALELYDKSVLANGDMSKDELEVGVQGVMSLMEPSYLEGKTKTAIHMRRLLFAASICVANASDGISKEETVVFEEFFGEGEFDKNLNVKALAGTLEERIKTVKEVASTPQRMQILNDLCTMSRASGHTTEPERTVMNEIADALDVPRSFICQSLAKDVEPD
ncbi:TerB family tellurite resistance protein [Leucothrix arctica]|uniref:tellurite resistance TerB family protein n=1 Tax=Leucothrix arctica TaxID=1481894 RepID=UPI001304C295|nr:TerB family tellurite resistance protein [Leucothrix arctica]